MLVPVPRLGTNGSGKYHMSASQVLNAPNYSTALARNVVLADPHFCSQCKPWKFIALSFLVEMIFSMTATMYTVEQRRIHETHHAYRLAVIHSSCGSHQLYYPASRTSFPTPLRHAEKQQLHWN